MLRRLAARIPTLIRVAQATAARTQCTTPFTLRATNAATAFAHRSALPAPRSAYPPVAARHLSTASPPASRPPPLRPQKPPQTPQPPPQTPQPPPKAQQEAPGGPQASRAVQAWLAGSAALVYGMVVLGGVTRLTESGLSMTTWSVTGSLPPMSADGWEAEFAKYKASPEYEKLNAGMDVDDFKAIFWYEYSHRMLGRAIGLAFVVPLGVFWARGMLSPVLKRRGAAIAAMIGGQGLLGWWMVRSGLRGEYDEHSLAPPRVSHYRLAAHLGSAVTIYSAMLWTLFGTLEPRRTALAPALARVLRVKSGAAASLLALTILSGALVAGLDAGLVYSEFPLMGGSIVPSDYFHPDKSLVANALENESAVQFHHRVLGLTTASAVVGLWVVGRRAGGSVAAAATVAGSLAAAQASLGIATLLMHVPVSLGAAHQAGSVALLSSLLWLMRVVRW